MEYILGGDKDYDVFSCWVKKYVEDNYNESVALVTEQVVLLSDNVNCVTATDLKKKSSQNFSVYEPDHHILNHAHIRGYVDGRPPPLKYSIGCSCSSNCSFILKFTRYGVQEPNCLTLCESDT